MKIACVLKSWAKEKGSDDSRYLSVPLYEVHYYDEYDVKWALQIVHVRPDGEEGQVLVEREIKRTGKSNHYIRFCDVTFIYHEIEDQIYCTQTLIEI
jgi:hypothetical protein